MPKDFDLFKALGEETKHDILKLLLRGEICACEIPGKIGKSQPNTSMHLSKLVEWDLIQYRREGKKIIYTIKDKRIPEMFKIATNENPSRTGQPL